MNYSIIFTEISLSPETSSLPPNYLTYISTAFCMSTAKLYDLFHSFCLCRLCSYRGTDFSRKNLTFSYPEENSEILTKNRTFTDLKMKPGNSGYGPGAGKYPAKTGGLAALPL